ncbi:MAG: ABC transporter permease [Planctomycetaceae bacterium]
MSIGGVPRVNRGVRELEEVAKAERVGVVTHRPANPWPRRALWVAGVAAAIVIGVTVFPGGFPDRFVVNARAPFDAFNNWVIDNRVSSPLFVHLLTPLSSAIQKVFDDLVKVMSRLTWLGLVAAAAVIAGLLAGWRLSIVAIVGFVSMGILAVWAASVETLALVLFAVAISVAIGVPFGIWSGRRAGVERVLRPILDAMQTIPAFAYLVPGVLIFGGGATTALIATVIFAIPPVIRLTALGIRQVPETSLEVGRAYGATERQLLRRVQLPMAKPSTILGVNQTIMMALGMVVIAASVGFGGLGEVVLTALESLKVGAALAGGLAIVAIAIVLDRTTYGWSRRDRTHRGSEAVRIGTWRVSRRVAALLGLAVVIAAVVIGRQVLRQQDFPTQWTVSLDGIDAFVRWVTRTFGGVTNWITDTMVRFALDPLRNLLWDLPWWMVCGFAALIGWLVSRRWTLPVMAFVCIAAVGVLGMWSDSMDTLSQVIVAVVCSVVLAIPIGIWSARSDRVERVLKPVLDTMQTMPQFVYLVPVVMLFGVGRVPGVIAALVYALPPGIRLTNLGIRQVPKEIVEAAEAYGANPRQTLWKVQVPLARPSILLGVNQTVILVFSTVIIAGLVGGQGLGYTIVAGLSHDPAGGMVAGICILLLAIAIDRITQAMGQAAPARVPRGRGIGVELATSGAESDLVEPLDMEMPEGEEDG